jgi:hypothetical protein
MALTSGVVGVAVLEWLASMARIGVKTLPTSSGPVAVAQRVSFTSLEASPRILCLEQAGDESPTPVLYQHCFRVRMSIPFMKAMLEHRCSPSPTTLAGALRFLRRHQQFPSCRRLLGKFLTVPACAFMCSTAMVCPAALDLADVVLADAFSGGCFAAVVAGLLLADALLLRVSWAPPLRMLCRRGCLLP